jgi:NAD(P)-dependent dehydrogenase (short-subunit alcohol dehydrogenase family)
MRSEPTREKMDLSDQVAIVTGGAQGIGRGIVEALAAQGADVLIGDLQVDLASETAADVQNAFDVEVKMVKCDVSEYDEAREMVQTAIDEFERVDFLVNNAGTGIPAPTFLDTDPEDWEVPLSVCLYGTLNCTHAVLPHMIDRGSGVIINFGSESYKGNDPGLSIYGSAKAANVSFSKTLAHEVGEDGIRVNLISPSTTRTPSTEDWIEANEEKILDSYALDRLGEPEDMGDAVAFLCSNAASWITGRALSVNGGYIRG